MGYYAKNPYEVPEAPRCPNCDDCMTERSVPFFPAAWICENPDCPDCPEQVVTDSLESLAEEVPPEPDTIASARDAAYGGLDLGEASAEELDIWWSEIKEIPFGEQEN